MRYSSIATISRNHPVAAAVLADAPDAWLVWARVIGNRRLMLDYIDLREDDPMRGRPPFYDFSPAASDIVEASWSNSDHGPWERYGEHSDTWRVQIEAGE